MIALQLATYCWLFVHFSASGFVFCGGMLRSGSTLQYNMAAELVERHKIGKREMWIDDHSGYFANAPGGADLIVFKSHLLSPQIEERVKGSGSIVLTCFRDVRDCVASWQVKTGSKLSLEDGLSCAAGAISNFALWEEIDCPRKLVSRYEDFVGNVAGETRRIAGLIGLDTRRLLRVDHRATLHRRIQICPDPSDSSGSGR